MSVSVCVSLCVCLSVRDHIFGTKRPIFTQFFTHAVCGCGSVFLWRRDDMLRISGFMDDVIFAPKLRLLDIAARLRQRGSHAALGLARRNTAPWLLGAMGSGSGRSGLLLAVRVH